MKLINTLIAMGVVLLLAFSASAQTEIKAADGSDLAGSTYIGDTFTVQIMKDGVPVGAGTNVVFVLANIGGDPIYVATDEDGKAKYKPLVNGMLSVKVLDGTTVAAEAEITVEDEPWVPVPTATKVPYSGNVGGGGGGGMAFTDPTPTPTTIPTVVDVVVPEPVDTPIVDQEVIDVIKDKLDSPKPKATPTESTIPGFGVVFAIAGIIGAVYAYRRM